jgi:hypothetical protein
MSETKRLHGSRLRDALVIVNPGACNPSGIALSIADACRELASMKTPTPHASARILMNIGEMMRRSRGGRVPERL